MSDRSEWATPDDFFDACNKRWGPFNLDAAASAENTRCSDYLDIEDDALQSEWRREFATENVWCNPPWGRHNIDWVRKASEEAMKGATVTMLLPAGISTQWFAELWSVATEIHFLTSRVQFVPPDGVKASSNDRDQVIVRFTQDGFESVFDTPVVSLWDWRNA